MLSRWLMILVLSVSLFTLPGPARSDTGGATDGVRAVLDRAMQIQTDPSLAGEAHRKDRAKLIRQLIGESFLPADMARTALGNQWDKLSAKQRTEFQDVFTSLFQDSYTRMVLNFLQKESIEYQGETAQGKSVQVKTVIMRANEHIPVNYTVTQNSKNKRWLIGDVEIDGVSIVENYRNTFEKAIQMSGFEGLMQKMRTQRQAAGLDSAS